jgi:Poly A polymerase head domain/Probable RNA and SrmB- binding site of polymerase A
MDERIRTAVAGVEAYVVGGAVRDELLGRPLIDVDVATHDPEVAARIYAGLTKGALFPLSERHGAWRVAFRDGHTTDFTPLRGDIEDDLRSRDFTINAIAVPAAGGERVDPLGGAADLEARRLRAVSESVFADDPLRLLRAVRLEDELGFALDEETESLVRKHADLVTEPAGERILGEFERLTPDGFRRADELGLLAPLGGSLARLADVDLVDSPGFLLVAVFGENLERFPISNELRRFSRTLLRAERPADGSAREIHRFRRATEPWALTALAFLGATDLYDAVRAARAGDPSDRLLTGEDILALGVAPGPQVGRLLELVEEERAAGTISTREEALALVRREIERGSTSAT